ncbi:MAG: 1-acyl-sn-glycerol-3-phosphate acyltransferase [Oscillospiraceae bacterium]|nr:1-acyl-sn-glycerol-3-phosphate acyltransferase [Oscillospiraceae bacterium]
MYLIARWLLSIYMRCKYKVHFHNKENIPTKKISKKGGFIIACNHQYYWDPPVVASFITGKFSFMAKSELFEGGKLFKWLIIACGAFPVKRGAGAEKALERAFEDIKKGRIFVIFPEGMRSKDGTIAKGKSGVALVASMADAPVLPICLMYGLNNQKNRLDYAVGEMIPAEELKIENERDRKELKRVSERVMNPIRELQQQIFDTINSE